MSTVREERLFSLTPTEKVILRRVACGETNRQIGRTLYRSPRTVEVHVRAIMGKVGLRTRVELARLAAEISLVPRIVVRRSDQ